MLIFFKEIHREHINKKIFIRDYQPEDVETLAKIYYNTIHRINREHYTEEQVNAWAPAAAEAVLAEDATTTATAKTSF